MLDVHGYPVDLWYLVLISQIMDNDAFHWAKWTFTPDMSWETVRALFFNHFASPEETVFVPFMIECNKPQLLDTILFGIKIIAEPFQHLMDVVTAILLSSLPIISMILLSFPKVWKNILSTLSTLSSLSLLQDSVSVERNVSLGTNTFASSKYLPPACKSFLGFAGYLYNFIPMFAQLVWPLDAHQYIKDVHPLWNQDYQDTFDTLKHILSNSPVLSLYDQSFLLLVGIDASQFSVGTILYQNRFSNKH